jgi:hypothetical protein
MTPLETPPPATWQVGIAAGDIVSFRFPYPDAPMAERARPCLVVDVEHESGEAVLVYGTSRWSGANRGQELHVTGPDILLASLDRPTRFIGVRRVRVALDSPRFIAGARGTPVVGRLPDTTHAQLDRLKQPQAPSRRRARGLRRPRATEAGPFPMLHRSHA